ncbi:MAG: ribose-5-phosphate isomerase RpiA [Betaproteobacteria bacterium]|nr:ribose-5-phosphate isomerase RpiA [Betaproteobacteria bacterium]
MAAATEEEKKAAAAAALQLITDNTVLGVGSGSTAEFFIALLPSVRQKIAAARASSERTARLLAAAGIPCNDDISELDLYVDGADEIDGNRQMLKGGGGALAREKVLAGCARKFVCIADSTKQVGRLGRFPLAVEVLPMARSFAARKLAAMGGGPRWREGFITDNGNWILDVSGLDLTAAAKMEMEINAIPGVVDNGVFARRRADAVFIGARPL